MPISKTVLALAILFATATHGAPLTKRIAQTIADSTAKWEQACVSLECFCSPILFSSRALRFTFAKWEPQPSCFGHFPRVKMNGRSEQLLVMLIMPKLLLDILDPEVPCK